MNPTAPAGAPASAVWLTNHLAATYPNNRVQLLSLSRKVVSLLHLTGTIMIQHGLFAHTATHHVPVYLFNITLS